MDCKNLSILGTSHIARQSLDEVRKKIDEFKPDIVALELDRTRLSALLSKPGKKSYIGMIRAIGFQGFMLNVIGAWAEKKLGKMVGVKPGSEMMLAYRIAQEKKLRVALIDQPIEITLKKFSKEFKFREKMRVVWDIVKSFFSKKPKLKIDLTKVPDEKMIESLVSQVKIRYPGFYKVLVDDRNKVMAANLAALMHHFPDQRIVAVVGAGHGKELIELIKQKFN
jgi:pheromone shutdown-related protein TraB